MTLNIPTEKETHQCTSYKEGDWVVFKCPICPQYEHRMNLIDNRMRTKGSSDDIQHTGMFDGSENVTEALIELSKGSYN